MLQCPSIQSITEANSFKKVFTSKGHKYSGQQMSLMCSEASVQLQQPIILVAALTISGGFLPLPALLSPTLPAGQIGSFLQQEREEHQ